MKVLYVTTLPLIVDAIRDYQAQGEFEGVEFSFLIEYFDQPMPSKVPANHWVCEDFSDTKTMVSMIEGLYEEGFEKVLTDDEYSLHVAARIRQSLELKGPTPEEVECYRDKVLMKERLCNSKIRVPRVYSIDNLRRGEYELPLLAKPRAFGGSQGVLLLGSEREVQAFLTTQASLVREGGGYKELTENDLQVEEYIEGKVYHLDGLAKGGLIRFFSASEYQGTCFDYASASHPLGSIMISESKELAEWRSFCQLVVEGLQLPDGAFHIEAFVNSEGEKVFLEAAARPGGAMVIPTIEQITGIDLRKEHVKLQLGFTHLLDVKEKPVVGGWLIFPKLFGAKDKGCKVTEVIPLAFQAMKSLISHKVPQIGDSAFGPFSFMATLGEFQFAHESRGLIEQDMQNLMTSYRVNTSCLQVENS